MPVTTHAAHEAGHVGGDDEDARADHRADDDHRGVVEPEPARELRIEPGGIGARRGRGF
jgi:hypothetical protein